MSIRLICPALSVMIGLLILSVSCVGPTVPSPTPQLGRPSPPSTPVATLISFATPSSTPAPRATATSAPTSTAVAAPTVTSTTDPTSAPTPTPEPPPIQTSTALPEAPTRTVTPAATLTPTPTPQDLPAGFEVFFIDVGQGDATLVVADTGETLLVDGGRSTRRIRERLKRLGVTDLDAIAMTHPDADHIAGLVEVLELYEIERIYLNGGESGTQTFARFMAGVNAEGADVLTVGRGAVISLGGLVLEVLHPGVLSRDTNRDSMVLLLDCGEVEVLLTGDAEVQSERAMMDAVALPDIDVLRVGHHGSRTATSQEFLDLLGPEAAVISAGLNSQYGHPHPEVLDRLSDAGVRVWHTDTTEEDDTLHLQSDCRTFEIGLTGAALSGSSAASTLPALAIASIPSPTPHLTATPSPVAFASTRVTIDCIFFDGAVFRSEADEYVQIVNWSDIPVDMAGWRLVDVADGAPTLVFPTYVLGPGQVLRVYTNQDHPRWGGFKFGYRRAVWNNRAPDTAALYDSDGREVSRKSYPPGC